MRPNHDERYMQRALELAARGQGYVEPNPMVGCVIVQNDEIAGEGWHEQFGGPHAEVNAIHSAGERSRGATMYVTLEPCCHQGKTPPCTQAVIEAGVNRVVIAQRDPYAEVAGGGFKVLRQAGLEVEVGTLQREARALNAPYLTLIERRRPWVIAKWAMTLDGKIATRSGDSRWISNDRSRAVAHQLRGRVDAVVVGRGTVEADDPLLTARPPGLRTALRVILDSQASISLKSRLVRTARETPVLIAAASVAQVERVNGLKELGCDVYQYSRGVQLEELLLELGRRRMTNILVEGGAAVLGSFFDTGLVDEVHAFIAPKIIGGQHARSAVSGVGCEQIANALRFNEPCVEHLGEDVYIHGTVSRDKTGLE